MFNGKWLFKDLLATEEEKYHKPCSTYTYGELLKKLSGALPDEKEANSLRIELVKRTVALIKND
jgi:hypothetical protein